MIGFFKKKNKKPEEVEEIVETVEEVQEVQEVSQPETGWFSRLTKGLSKTSNKLTENIGAVLTKKKLDADTLEELEEALIVADMGPETAMKLTVALSKERFGKDITDEEVREFLADEIEKVLEPVMQTLVLEKQENGPCVVLMAGVNGAGKTTTIGKMAHYYSSQGKKVMLAAGDTFRAAAVEQLKVWGERSNCPVISKDTGADAGALAYEAYAEAKKQNMDILFIDTAGRLQNRTELMAELEKVVRVIKKQDETAPHATLLVLDATTGQNAHSQVDIFSRAANVSGLVMTKLDGSAKGGVIVSLAEKFKTPIYAIGIGEKIDDLRSFEAKAFARSLMGLSE